MSTVCDCETERPETLREVLELVADWWGWLLASGRRLTKYKIYLSRGLSHRPTHQHLTVYRETHALAIRWGLPSALGWRLLRHEKRGRLS